MERIEGGELPRNGCATGSTHMPAFPAPARSLPQPRFAPPDRQPCPKPQAPAPQQPKRDFTRPKPPSLNNRLHPCLILDRPPPVVTVVRLLPCVQGFLLPSHHPSVSAVNDSIQGTTASSPVPSVFERGPVDPAYAGDASCQLSFDCPTSSSSPLAFSPTGSLAPISTVRTTASSTTEPFHTQVARLQVSRPVPLELVRARRA